MNSPEITGQNWIDNFALGPRRLNWVMNDISLDKYSKCGSNYGRAFVACPGASLINVLEANWKYFLSPMFRSKIPKSQ